MSDAPVTQIDLAAFTADPYPSLARMRREAPITYVPQLDATLLTRRDDIHRQEKRIDVFSSEQPDGLMTRLMGQNMMRKDSAAHMSERRILFPAVSPRNVQRHWKPIFEQAARSVLHRIFKQGQCDLVTEFAMPISGEALKALTGLTTMRAEEMDAVSQAMIDGCANYAGHASITARCHAATARIDRHIDRMRADPPPGSALAVMIDGGMAMDSIRANIKLMISGGQNEPRDAIAGTLWALLSHPGQLALIASGSVGYEQAFAEYARWISPIGMSPRRIARPDRVDGVTFDTGDKVFLMFGSAGRDAAHFDRPDMFDVTRDTQPAISFGAGPHFCAGAAAARCLIAEIALPMVLSHLPQLRLAGDVTFSGWAFRGPVSVPVRWNPR